MGGFDDHGSIIGDWMLPSPSPRFFFSGGLGDDDNLRSISEPKGENRGEFAFPELEGQIGHENANDFDRQLADISAVNQATKSGPFSEQKMNSGKGLGARIAARGFNAPRLNTEGIRPANISQNPEVRSPYLTIPPGLSPTTLLDSPVFLSNSLVQPSPTTGKFQFAANGNGKSSMMFSEASDKNKDNFFEGINTASFAFKPVADSAPNTRSAISQVTPSFLARQPSPSIEVSVQSDNSVEANNVSSEDRPYGVVAGSAENSPPLDEQQDEDTDQRFSEDANVKNATAEDGYNWRKYGQKQVKGSEYPRSYYKCTHPNCPVKKKVERSHEGHITEMIYKGDHSHPKPPPNRRSVLGSSNALCDMQVDMTEQGGPNVDGDPGWMQKGTADGRHDNLEVISSAQLGLLQAQNGSQFESTDPVDVSSNFSNDEEEDDHGKYGSVSLGCDGEGDESESKRRKVEASAADVSGATRAIREPRVVVQTTSEVDILDDGYRWRKYGQKVVKGNPNPRSYYKCTSAGCTVRKHVERASHDLKSVITTYEGKHNHDVPAARNSSHMNSSVSNTMSAQGQSGQTQIHRPESSQLENTMARFERPHSLGSFGLAGRQQLGPPHGFGFGMNQPGLANLAMAGLGPNQGKMPALPVHTYLGQQRQMNETGFMLPKGEPKVEPMSETGLNPSSGAAVYHQMMMNRLPLGPQM